MKLIDTHSHIFLEDFDEDRSLVVARAKDQGVEKILLPNIDEQSFTALINLHKEYPDVCLPMVGVHPTSVKENFKEELSFVEAQLKAKEYPFVAVGEIGIDLYWDKTFQKQQELAFVSQIELAEQYDLPIVIHARDSFQEIFSVLKSLGRKNFCGVFHSFTGGLEDAKQAIAYGFELGFNGILTFKNSKLGEIVEKVDLKHLLIETDSPYLAPVPKRGRRNESSYVLHVAEKIAEIKGVDLTKVAEVTSENAKRLFKLS